MTFFWAGEERKIKGFLISVGPTFALILLAKTSCENKVSAHSFHFTLSLQVEGFITNLYLPPQLIVT